MRASRRTTLADLALLTLLCAGLYALAPASHGLTNWQEGIRALAASEMGARHDWLTPTVAGQAYLAKPPLISWAQLALHTLAPDLAWDTTLRLVVALFGTLGVLATYLGARTILAEAFPGEPETLARRRALAGARWSALFLATGILHVRSSRIGELDVLLVAPTLLAIASFLVAWRRARQPLRMRLLPVALATLGATLATLTKGPPALLVIALATIGAVCLRSQAGVRLAPTLRMPVIALGVVLALGSLVLTLSRVDELNQGVAAVAFPLLAFGAVVILARLLTTRAAPEAFATLARTHPAAILLVPLLVLWAWYASVDAAAPDAALTGATATREAGDNLVLLYLDAPHDNLEALLFAVGVGSPLAIAGAWTLLRERAGLTKGLWVVVAWVGLSLVAFSVLGRGTPRYLTSVWPGVAILAGHFFSTRLAQRQAPDRERRPAPGHPWTDPGLLVGVMIAALAIGQAWWYAIGRQQRVPQRTCREFVREVLASPLVPPGTHLASLDFWEPAADLYAGRHVTPIEDQSDHVDYPHGAIGLDEFGRMVHETDDAPWVVLTALRPLNPHWREALVDPADRLRGAGLVLEPIEVGAPFACDRKRNLVRAWVVRPDADIPTP